MHKKLIAVAAITASGLASAQSNVTLFGIVDATLAWGRGSVADRVQLSNSGYAASRLGFRGVEDLGGGMSASFWLEAQLANDNGTGVATNINNQPNGGPPAGVNGGQGLVFHRRSTVSLAGPWGEARLGRDLSPQYNNHWMFDPFNNNGVGTSQAIASIITGVTSFRASNSLTPSTLGGFYGHFMYYLGENAQNGAATEDDGTGYGLRVGYESGPFNGALAVSRTKYAAGTVEQNNLAGSYDLGFAKLFALIGRDKNGASKGRAWHFGAHHPIGPGIFRWAYSRYTTDIPVGADPTSAKFAIGYIHNLSKRTALYATDARVKNSNGATAALNGSTTSANGSSSGLDLGVRHAF